MKIRVREIEDGGPIVQGTKDPVVARWHLLKWYRDNGSTPVEAYDHAFGATIRRAGLFRWSPCNPRSCYSDGGHIGHLQYADKPGRGVWLGVEYE